MSLTIPSLVACVVLCLIQLLAALPWLAGLDWDAFKSWLRRPSTWGIALAGVVGAGAILAVAIAIIQDRARLLFWGLPYGALLQAQLTLDFFVFAFLLLTVAWPKGGAVALAAFRESVRQPMFWLLAGAAGVLMLVYPFIPYFTFGEDYKMVKEMGYDTTMLFPVIFGVLAASMSISEEIEGRTAITLMSKPVSRRQFLLGKFFGILLACLLMTGLITLGFAVVLWFKPWYDGEPLTDPAWVDTVRSAWGSSFGEVAVNFALGAAEWFDMTLSALPWLLLGFCQVMVLVAIAVALATRLPMVVNLVICFVVWFLGHLTPVLVHVSQAKYALVNFMAKFFDNVLPGLELFNPSTAISRDIPLPTGPLTQYLLSVALYAVIYTVIALLFGLILFEDRDLA